MFSVSKDLILSMLIIEIKNKVDNHILFLSIVSFSALLCSSRNSIIIYNFVVNMNHTLCHRRKNSTRDVLDNQTQNSSDNNNLMDSINNNDIDQ